MEASFLSAFPDDALDELLADAIYLDIPAVGVPYRESDLPRAGLVINGLVRVYMTSREGRQVTVRYARRGDMLGVPAQEELRDLFLKHADAEEIILPHTGHLLRFTHETEYARAVDDFLGRRLAQVLDGEMLKTQKIVQPDSSF